MEENRQKQRQKRRTGMLSAFLALLLLLAGTFAWFYVTNAMNEFGGKRDDVNSAVLHDDFEEENEDDIHNKDVYVENTGSERIYVRICLDEYMEIAEQSLIPGADKMDESTWKTHTPDGTDPGGSSTFSDYWQWKLGGDSVEYAPSVYGSNGVVSRYAADGTDLLDPEAAGNAWTHEHAPSGIITIKEYVTLSQAEQEAFEGWIMDEDGYAYWYVKLDSEKATGLLLDEVELTGNIPDGKKYYYAINVVLETVNETDLIAWLDGITTKDGANTPDEVGTEDMKRYLKGLSEQYVRITDEMNETTPPAEDYDHDGDGFLDPDEMEEYKEAKRTTLESIRVKKNPDKMIYLEGDSFDPEGMILELIHGDKHTEEADSGYSYEPQGALSPAQTTITITYQGKEITLDITVNARQLTDIAITNPPNKTSYYAGDTFSTAGMEVIAYYNNSSEADVTSQVTVNPSGTLTTDNTSVTISYTDGEITKTKDQNITVKAIELDRIKITNPPAKTTYLEGERFRDTEMEVTAYYNNNTEKVVSGYTITPDRVLAMSDTAVTISYAENGITRTDSVTITVNAVLPTSITIEKGPDKDSYEYGDTFTTTGMVVRAYYNNGTNALVTDYSANVTTLTPSTHMSSANNVTQQITISYTSNGTTVTKTQNVTVTNPLQSITLDTSGVTTSFYKNATFSYSGLKVTANYKSGYAPQISSGYNVSSPVMTSSGSKTVTVSYTSNSVTKSRTYTVTIKAYNNAVEEAIQPAKEGNTVTIEGTTWIILAKNSDGTAELLAKDCPEKYRYNSTGSDNGWKWSTSTMRTYLRGDYRKSLPADLSDNIVTVSKNTNLPGYGLSTTGDKQNETIYLLSYAEYQTYEAKYSGKLYSDGITNVATWWLRTPDEELTTHAYYVTVASGDVVSYFVVNVNPGMRPALTVKYQ